MLKPPANNYCWTNIHLLQLTRARTGTCAGSSFGVETHAHACPHQPLGANKKTQISSIGRVMDPMELSSNRHRVRLLLISVHLFGCSLLSSVVCSCVRHKACKVPVPAPLLVVAHAQRMLSARSQN